MVKVERARTADCVVGGFRLLVDRPLPCSLLLGAYDGPELLHLGIASSFSERRRHELLARLRPLAGHPWAHGFLLPGGAAGRLRGSAGRWNPQLMPQDWVPVAPELVCEASYDQLDGRRFRHPARFVRWRSDRDAASSAVEQLELPRVNASTLLRGT